MNTNNNQLISRGLLAAREERGLGRTEVADDAGISYSYLANLETGARVPSIEVLRGVLEALDLTLAVFFASLEV